MIMNQELLKRVQKDCLEIMIDIDKVCRENNIDYSLCGGSVIGAMLYNGFIPWDDDIDIMMTRKNYEKFLKLYISKTTSNKSNNPLKTPRFCGAFVCLAASDVSCDVVCLRRDVPFGVM